MGAYQWVRRKLGVKLLWSKLHPMAPVADRRGAKSMYRISSLCCHLTLNDPFLMGVMTRRTRDAPSRHKWEDYQESLFSFSHDLLGLGRRFYEKMLRQKVNRHKRMTPPAKEADIGPELYVFSPIYSRVRFFRMTSEAYRLAILHFDIAIVIQHVVGVKCSVFFRRVTFETYFPAVRVRPTPQ